MPYRKHQRARAEKKLTAAILMVGDAESCPDIRYVSGFRAVDPVLCLKQGAQCQLVVPQLEAGRARREAAAGEVFTPEMLGLRGPRRWRFSEQAAELLRRGGIREVTVAGFFPHGVAARLQRKGIRVRIAEHELFPGRAVKRPVEVKHVREAQQAAVIAMRAAVQMIAAADVDAGRCLVLKGKRLTSEDVRRRITHVLLDHNCRSRETIVAGGMQAVDPHETGHGPLKAHEAIVIDIFPQHQDHGYWGDITRTVVKGEAPPSLRTMYLAVKAAQTAALNRVRAGARTDSVHRAAVAEFERRGFRTEVVDGKGSGFVHGTGHGVGLAIHEGPSLGLAKGWLRAGHVVTVEPGLYYPGIGGIRIEDTVVVTPGGWKYLVPCEKRFEV